MIEELKLIKDIFNNATNNALIAYGLYLITPLIKTSLIVFPIMSTIKFIMKKVSISDD